MKLKTPKFTTGTGARRSLAAVLWAAAVLLPSAAAAQLLPSAPCDVQTVTTRLIEWDTESFGDTVPGSIAVDDRSSSRSSKLWFATRLSGAVEGETTTRVYRLTPGRHIKKDDATAKSWALGAEITGGVRLRHSNDGRFVFVNTQQNVAQGGLVAVDTADNTRVTWIDRVGDTPLISDVSIDTRDGGHNVYTAALRYSNGSSEDGTAGVVQRLRPRQAEFRDGRWVVPADVVRWPVGFGAGTCEGGGLGGPCIPGIAVDRRHGHAIYVSEPDFPVKNSLGVQVSRGAIGEIDPRTAKCSDGTYSCATVRHWGLPAGIGTPRQIYVDDIGKVWGTTSTGYLFSLEIDRHRNKAVVTIHNPIGELEDLFDVAADGGTVGFTDTENNEVSVLLPDRAPRTIYPLVATVKALNRRIFGNRENANPLDHKVTPRTVTASGSKYTIENDGTYVETNIFLTASDVGFGTGSPAPSQNPTGIAPDGARKTGSFFYGVGNSEGTNRVGHLESPVDRNKDLDYRKDDDDYDDDGEDDAWDNDDDGDNIYDSDDNDDDNDCVPDYMDDDHDNDGNKNEHDSQSHRENKRSDSGTLAPGQSKEYEMEWDSHSVAILAIIEATDLLAPLTLELVDANGAILVSVPASLGKALATFTPALPGLYAVRVKNTGTTETTYKATLIGKQIWF